MPKTVDIALDEQGFPGSVVRLKDPRYMPRRKFEALAATMADSAASENTDKADEFLRSRVASWDISYVDDDKESFALKDVATDNFGDLPTPLYVFLWTQLGKTFEIDVPKG